MYIIDCGRASSLLVIPFWQMTPRGLVCLSWGSMFTFDNSLPYDATKADFLFVSNMQKHFSLKERVNVWLVSFHSFCSNRLWRVVSQSTHVGKYLILCPLQMIPFLNTLAVHPARLSSSPLTVLSLSSCRLCATTLHLVSTMSSVGYS